MQQVGDSSLWEYKYRPQTVNDLILPNSIKTYFLKMVEEGELSNLLLYSSAGRGKTSSAIALCNDIDAEYLYINASKENNIDTIRFKVEQFATSYSLNGQKKVVILDEAECLSNNVGNGAGAQNALKSLIEVVESHCRFIFTTNNISKINEALISRCNKINFNFSPEENIELKKNYFKRLCWVLEKENIEFDKKILAEFVKKHFPDFRKTIQKLQLMVKINGVIDERIFQESDDAKIDVLIKEMKEKKFNNIRKIIVELDYVQFFSLFYKTVEPHIQPESIPELILILSEYDYKSSMCNDKEICLTACVIEMMKEVKWR